MKSQKSIQAILKRSHPKQRISVRKLNTIKGGFGGLIIPGG